MASNLQIDAKGFDEAVLKSSLPVLVDFWATWCGPCLAIAPSIEQLATELEGKVKVVKFDVDSDQEIAARYGIMSIPSLLLFKDGRVVDQLVGAHPKDRIKSFAMKHAS